jgi:hypothetical protein|tara:strand:+ start:207 stop:566 length:360 start_codon:yes stop_codon:yes gene_type:complete
MAHFAKIENGIVTNILVVNNDIITVDNEEIEQKGKDFLASLLRGSPNDWVQTSSTIRKNHAAKEYIYDSIRDAFYTQQPYPSWSLNEDSCHWEAPIEKPDDESRYIWDEATLSWINPEI